MNIKLNEFVIMPNHIHGIIEIGENKYNKWNGTVNNLQNGNGDGNGCKDTMHCVFTIKNLNE